MNSPEVAGASPDAAIPTSTATLLVGLCWGGRRRSYASFKVQANEALAASTEPLAAPGLHVYISAIVATKDEMVVVWLGRVQKTVGEAACLPTANVPVLLYPNPFAKPPYLPVARLARSVGDLGRSSLKLAA